ncbi:hypothetical protein [Flexivirga alba]|uniref:Uncharacterized protein n=1 Tax=Flexivirga alba TaxID=702742 RepID=A0ABW2ADW8_9MICO
MGSTLAAYDARGIDPRVETGWRSPRNYAFVIEEAARPGTSRSRGVASLVRSATPFDVVTNHVRLGADELTRLADYVADNGVAASSAGPIPEDTGRGPAVPTCGSAATQRPVAELAAVHAESGAGRPAGKVVVIAP